MKNPTKPFPKPSAHKLLPALPRTWSEAIEELQVAPQGGGSLRVVADTSGSIIKRIDYDTFGNIIEETNRQMTIPLGFAGGCTTATPAWSASASATIVRKSADGRPTIRFCSLAGIRIYTDMLAMIRLIGLILGGWMQPFGAIIMEVNGTVPQMEIGEVNVGVVANIHVDHKAWVTHPLLIAGMNVMRGTIDATIPDNLLGSVTKIS